MTSSAVAESSFEALLGNECGSVLSTIFYTALFPGQCVKKKSVYETEPPRLTGDCVLIDCEFKKLHCCGCRQAADYTPKHQATTPATGAIFSGSERARGRGGVGSHRQRGRDQRESAKGTRQYRNSLRPGNSGNGFAHLSFRQKSRHEEHLVVGIPKRVLTGAVEQHTRRRIYHPRTRVPDYLPPSN